MIPRLLIDTAPLPGGGELKLFRRGEEYSIMLGGNELMNSRVSGSEQALAELALARIGGRKAPSVLIGGLGMGFTLRAALDRLPPDAQVTVAELVPAVVEWAREPMAEVFGGSLDDPRVEVVQADVASLIDQANNAHDAILLDVDNGPDGLTVETNDRLYDKAGLAAARTALRPDGVLAVWSAAPDAAFAARLRRAGFRVEEEIVRARGRKGARHVIWLGRR
jgi:spermidine synthase